MHPDELDLNSPLPAGVSEADIQREFDSDDDVDAPTRVNIDALLMRALRTVVDAADSVQLAGLSHASVASDARSGRVEWPDLEWLTVSADSDSVRVQFQCVETLMQRGLTRSPDRDFPTARVTMVGTESQAIAAIASVVPQLAAEHALRGIYESMPAIIAANDMLAAQGAETTITTGAFGDRYDPLLVAPSASGSGINAVGTVVARSDSVTVVSSPAAQTWYVLPKSDAAVGDAVHVHNARGHCLDIEPATQAQAAKYAEQTRAHLGASKLRTAAVSTQAEYTLFPARAMGVYAWTGAASPQISVERDQPQARQTPALSM